MIKLRQGLKFHDGKPVRAQDCAPILARWAARDADAELAADPIYRDLTLQPANRT